MLTFLIFLGCFLTFTFSVDYYLQVNFYFKDIENKEELLDPFAFGASAMYTVVFILIKIFTA